MNDELDLTNEDIAFLQFCGISADEDPLMAALEDPKLEAIRMIHNDDKDTLGALTDALDAEVARVQRVGKPGPWCAECAVLEKVSPAQRCECHFQESFGCSTGKLCRDCATARERVARHLEEMFAAKTTIRADGARLRLFEMLRDAAFEGDYDGAPKERLMPGQRLKFELAQADPFSEKREQFRDDVLRAFRRSRFLDFRGLARSLDRYQEYLLFRAAMRFHEALTR